MRKRCGDLVGIPMVRASSSADRNASSGTWLGSGLGVGVGVGLGLGQGLGLGLDATAHRGDTHQGVQVRLHRLDSLDKLHAHQPSFRCPCLPDAPSLDER